MDCIFFFLQIEYIQFVLKYYEMIKQTKKVIPQQNRDTDSFENEVLFYPRFTGLEL